MVRWGENLYRQKTVAHNDLITSIAKIDKISLNFFGRAAPCLDTENLPEDDTVPLSKNEYHPDLIVG